MVREEIKVEAEWIERERATAACVQACFDEFLAKRGRRDADSLLAICQLTWITSGDDNTSKVLVPALGKLLGEELHAKTHRELQTSLASVRVPARVRRSLEKDVGFTNFYNVYRKSTSAWMRQHSRRVLPILQRARRLRSDSEARELYKAIQALPRIQANGRAIHVEYFLTPVVACLDPRGRCPIINGRKTVQDRLRKLGLASSTLVEQLDGLVGLFYQAGISDAFELDQFEGKITALSKGPPGPTSAAASSRPLGEKDAGEVRVLLKARSTKYTRLHNKMTNRLLRLAKDAELECDEGKDPNCRYDARVMDYDRKGRDLLIEAKAATDIQFCRMAVGQLFDYRRRLSARARTDIAGLFPRRPPADACDFLRSVGVKVVWFDSSMRRIIGDMKF